LHCRCPSEITRRKIRAVSFNPSQPIPWATLTGTTALCAHIDPKAVRAHNRIGYQPDGTARSSAPSAVAVPAVRQNVCSALALAVERDLRRTRDQYGTAASTPLSAELAVIIRPASTRSTHQRHKKLVPGKRATNRPGITTIYVSRRSSAGSVTRQGRMIRIAMNSAQPSGIAARACERDALLRATGRRSRTGISGDINGSVDRDVARSEQEDRAMKHTFPEFERAARSDRDRREVEDIRILGQVERGWVEISHAGRRDVQRSVNSGRSATERGSELRFGARTKQQYGGQPDPCANPSPDLASVTFHFHFLSVDLLA